MLNVFIRLFILVISIFSSDAVSYQSLSNSLNPSQYNQQQLDLRKAINKQLTNKRLSAEFRIKYLAKNNFLVNSFQINSIAFYRQKLTECLCNTLFVRQQLIAEQSYFITQQIKLKFSISAPESLS